MKIIMEIDSPNVMYFTKYMALFDPEEWTIINLIEGELIPLINQFDEVTRDQKLKEYEEFRKKLNEIWETYLLEREAIRLEVGQEKVFENGIKIHRIA
jgi:hypothetical protein